MRARQFRARMDEHMGRMDEHMGRMDVHMARGNELMAEVREEMRLTREQHRENMSRYEKLAAEQQQFMREILAEVRHVAARQIRALDNLSDEILAQRKGLLAVLDSLRGQQPGSSGASA
jgi:archaellum component FlaC